MKKFLKGSEGFTLVELMVVVAIIGILSAVAIPNFKKYQAKSKQSEAKIQLAALYSAEVTANSDYDTYATCLAIMGYERVPRGYYVVGFAAGYDATANNTAFTGCVDTADFAFTPSVQQLNAVAANMPTAIAGATSTDQNTFTAGAEASISNAVAQDRWTINQAKALVNTVPGI